MAGGNLLVSRDNDDDDDDDAKHSARDWAGPPRDSGSYCFEQKLKIDPSRP